MLRATITAICTSLLLTSSIAVAEQRDKVYRVGVILTTSPLSDMAGSHPAHGGIDNFLRELESLGYFEGQNLIVERRSAEGRPERYREIASELVRRKVNVIVTVGNAMTQRAKEVTSTVPIVMNFSIDPVGAGIVQSLAHPGGNVTGVSVEAGAQLEAKRLALLTEAAPRASKIAFLGLKDDWESPEGRSVRAAAEQLRLTMFFAEAKPNEFSSAFAAIERGHADAVFVSPSPPHWVHRKTIVDFAARRQLPSTYLYRQSVEIGGLMSYGVDTSQLFRRSAAYVDKILKGANPGELPIEQPAKFELVINLNTAKKLRLTIPSSLLLQADRVIE